MRGDAQRRRVRGGRGERRGWRIGRGASLEAAVQD